MMKTKSSLEFHAQQWANVSFLVLTNRLVMEDVDSGGSWVRGPWELSVLFLVNYL